MTNTRPLIFDHQTIAYDKLLTAARVCLSPYRELLPLRPRTNSLVVGPSGSGKTHIAGAVAGALEIPCKHISVAEWILLGCTSRGAARTWNAIFDFLVESRAEKGAVIFLDEIDKLNGTTDWVQYLRVEVYRLLDLDLPPDLLDEDDVKYATQTQEAAKCFLQRKTFIVAAGAFQDFWDGLGKRVGGFGGETGHEAPAPAQLSRYLPRELVNRFRSDIVVLPDLGARDYENILSAAAEKMPEQLRDRFLSLGAGRIAEARANRQGVRFLEELAADVLAEEEAPGQPRAPAPSLWKLHPHVTRAPGK